MAVIYQHIPEQEWLYHRRWLLYTQQTKQKEIFCETPSVCWNLQHWGWGVEDLVDPLPFMRALLGHSILFSTVDSAHLPVSSLHCSPDAKVLCLGVWAHRLGVVVAELCIIPVLCLLLTFCSTWNMLEYVSRKTAVAISVSSPFLSRLSQTGTHRRPCCA